MDIEKVVGTALGVTASICLVAFAVIKRFERIESEVNKDKEQELIRIEKKRSRFSNFFNLSFSFLSEGDTYENFEGNIKVRVKRIYYNIGKENTILYSKYNKNTGSYIGTYSMPESRFRHYYY